MKRTDGLCRRIAGCLAAVLCCLAGSGVGALASVTSERAQTGAADTLYVAGNPDLYPLEYYDAGSAAYRGVFPELLEKISDATGLSFTYVAAGSEDQRQRLARNQQVELVTAFLSGDEDWAAVEPCPVLTVDTDGSEKTYCLGFTQRLSGESAACIRQALANISEAEKTGLLLSYAQENRAMPRSRFRLWIGAAAGGAVLLTLAVVLAVKRRRRKKERKKDWIDALTGVGNETYYLYCFHSLISEQAKSLYHVAYIAFEAEQAENLWGKPACGEIQKYAAANLTAAAGATDCLCRIQDGVFVLVFQAETEAKADARARELVERLREYLAGFSEDWRRLFAAGICHLAEHPDVNAETALYSARQGYLCARRQNQPLLIGSDARVAESRKNTRLRLQIRDALENGDFRIYMQFITACRTGAICGAEVLSRWQNPEFGLLRPREYIDLLMETGMIVPHDYTVFAHVCRRLEQWSGSPRSRLFLTCNFTRVSVAQPDFADRIREIAGEYSFSHDRLVIEVTENSLAADTEIVSRNIRRCAEMGFKIAIDDMGAGFSSFADLYDNEIHVVKIEREFITVCTTERRRQMLQDTISLVHHTGAAVICEGIEDKEQQTMLRALGCDMIQGFYCSRVLPLSECERFIQAGTIVEKPILGDGRRKADALAP